MLEVHEAVVNKADLEAARRGDDAARKRLAASLDGVVLYCHGFAVDDESEVVTVQELGELQIVDAVRLYRRIPKD